jgi:hypothetical protein
MLNTVSPIESVAQTQCPFEQHDLVFTHLIDPAHDNRAVPVTGVVVTPGALTSTVRIRNLKGITTTIVVLNRDLVAR